MARLKPRAPTEDLDAIRGFLDRRQATVDRIADLAGSPPAIEPRLAALNAGEPIVLHAWELESSFPDRRFPANETFLVHPDGRIEQ
jgi:hypothetical protein